MGGDLADIAERLSGISDELADLALDRLHQAAEAVSGGDEPDTALGAEERRITRARRAVDKAAALLTPGRAGANDADGAD